MSNKWIRLSFNGAKIPFYDRGVILRGLLKTDIVRNYESVGVNVVSKRIGRRHNICPETIFVDGHIEGSRYGDIYHPIGLPQISNMLCALCGEKPVSTYHPRIINGEREKRNTLYDSIVMDGYMRLTSPFHYKSVDKEGNIREKLIVSCTQSTKSTPSNRDWLPISWFTLRSRFAGKEDRYAEVMQMFMEYTGVEDLERRFYNVSEVISWIVEQSGRKGEFEERLKKEHLYSLMNGTFRRCDSVNKFGSVSERNGIMHCIVLDGEFIFSVPDDVYNKIMCGPKFASYLEGGFIALEKWETYGVNEYFNCLIDRAEIEDEGFYSIKDVIERRVEI